MIAGNGAAIVWMWLHDGGISGVHGRPEAFTSLGRITGLLGVYLALLQVLMLSRLAAVGAARRLRQADGLAQGKRQAVRVADRCACPADHRGLLARRQAHVRARVLTLAGRLPGNGHGDDRHGHHGACRAQLDHDRSPADEVRELVLRALHRLCRHRARLPAPAADRQRIRRPPRAGGLLDIAVRRNARDLARLPRRPPDAKRGEAQTSGEERHGTRRRV